MADPVLFDFAVPDELLQEVVAKSSDPDVVAALERLAAKHGPRFAPDEGWKTLKP